MYIDRNVIQNLEDDKRLCDYNIRGLLQHGLLAKQALNIIFVKPLAGNILYELECYLNETTECIKDMLEQKSGLATYLFNLQWPVAGIAIKDYPILCCKRPILRVGVWPIWVCPAHCPFGQSIICTSRVTYSKMSDFCLVVFKWQTFVFLSSLFCLILVLS